MCCSVALVVCINNSLLLNMADQLPSGLISATYFVATIGMLVVVAGALLSNARNGQALPMAIVDGAYASPPELQLTEMWHLFLSHIWSTGQDQARVIKQGLRR